jgi:hypothetical protein
MARDDEQGSGQRSRFVASALQGPASMKKRMPTPTPHPAVLTPSVLDAVRGAAFESYLELELAKQGKHKPTP